MAPTAGIRVPNGTRARNRPGGHDGALGRWCGSEQTPTFHHDHIHREKT